MRYGDDHSPEVDFQGFLWRTPRMLMPLVTPIFAACLISAGSEGAITRKHQTKLSTCLCTRRTCRQSAREERGHEDSD